MELEPGDQLCALMPFWHEQDVILRDQKQTRDYTKAKINAVSPLFS